MPIEKHSGKNYRFVLAVLFILFVAGIVIFIQPSPTGFQAGTATTTVTAQTSGSYQSKIVIPFSYQYSGVTKIAIRAKPGGEWCSGTPVVKVYDQSDNQVSGDIVLPRADAHKIASTVQTFDEPGIKVKKITVEAIDRVDVYIDCNYIDWAEAALYVQAPALIMEKQGSGAGTIIANDYTGTGDYTCSAQPCTKYYPTGTKVVLTAVPSTGSVFNSWTGCTPYSYDQSMCEVNIGTYGRTIAANFEAVQSSGSTPPSTQTIQTIRSTTTTNHPPVAIFATDKTAGTAPLKVSFDASASYDNDNNTIYYSWDFGDNTQSAYGKTVSHVFSNAGNYTVKLGVRDNVDSRTAMTTITVAPQPAVSTSINNAAPTADDTVQISATAFQTPYKIKELRIYVDGNRISGCSFTPPRSPTSCTSGNPRTFSQGTHYYNAEATTGDDRSVNSTIQSFNVTTGAQRVTGEWHGVRNTTAIFPFNTEYTVNKIYLEGKLGAPTGYSCQGQITASLLNARNRVVGTITLPVANKGAIKIKTQQYSTPINVTKVIMRNSAQNGCPYVDYGLVTLYPVAS